MPSGFLIKRNRCPVCDLDGQKAQAAEDWSWRVHCLRCGDFKIGKALADDIPGEASQQPSVRRALSELIKRSSRPMTSSAYVQEDLERALKAFTPAGVDEQANDLLLFVASQIQDYGKAAFFRAPEAQSSIRAVSQDNVLYVLREQKILGLINWDTLSPNLTVDEFEIQRVLPTFKGWERIDELKRRNVASKTAFMAMGYGDPELDALLDTHIRPAVLKTGYRLERLDEKRGSGLIDNRMRVEIRNSRFVIVDLTHENRGAYWEAGYAEGLGRPVIYICNAEIFKSKGTHFDTSHQATILWDRAQLDKFVDALKSTIRFDVPEAVQSDRD